MIHLPNSLFDLPTHTPIHSSIFIHLSIHLSLYLPIHLPTQPSASLAEVLVENNNLRRTSYIQRVVQGRGQEETQTQRTEQCTGNQIDTLLARVHPSPNITTHTTSCLFQLLESSWVWEMLVVGADCSASSPVWNGLRHILSLFCWENEWSGKARKWQ